MAPSSTPPNGWRSNQWSAERTKSLIAARDANSDPPAQLLAMVTALFSYARGPNWPPLVLEFWSQGLGGGEVATRLGRAYREWARLFSKSAGSAFDGRLATTPDEAALLILVAHDGLVAGVASGRVRPAELSPEQAARRVLASLRPSGGDAALDETLSPVAARA